MREPKFLGTLLPIPRDAQIDGYTHLTIEQMTPAQRAAVKHYRTPKQEHDDAIPAYAKNFQDRVKEFYYGR